MDAEVLLRTTFHVFIHVIFGSRSYHCTNLGYPISFHTDSHYSTLFHIYRHDQGAFSSVLLSLFFFPFCISPSLVSQSLWFADPRPIQSARDQEANLLLQRHSAASLCHVKKNTLGCVHQIVSKRPQTPTVRMGATESVNFVASNALCKRHLVKLTAEIKAGPRKTSLSTSLVTQLSFAWVIVDEAIPLSMRVYTIVCFISVKIVPN